jgi:Acyl-CoA synthetases (AMP-forming)/AMP-acid ligases II
VRGDGLRTLGDVLDEAFVTYPDVPVFFRSRDAIVARPLADLLDEARAVAAGLKALGVGPGSRVAVQLPNCQEHFVVQAASIILGAVLVPIVPVFGAVELGAILADAAPDVLVVRDRWRTFDYLHNIDQLSARQRPRHVVVAGAQVPKGTVSFDFLHDQGRIETVHHAEPDDPVLIIYTSGSTGVPKGVIHSHRSILAEAAEPQYAASPSGDGPQQMQATGAGHIGGYLYAVRIMQYGNRILVLDWWDTEVAARAIAEFRIRMFAGTPFHLASVLDVGAGLELNLSHLKQVVIGGAPVSPHLIERADAAGVIAVRSYGLSEHPTVATGRFEDDLFVRANFDGVPGEGTEILIVNDAGVPVGPGVAGEVLTRGPDRFVGYTNVPDAEAFAEGGWLRTGDIGRLDAQGRLTIVDRKRHIIIRGGENLSIAEIEMTVARHPDVAEVAVVGVPDERYGERVCAFVVPKQSRTVTLESLAQLFAELGVARQKVPEFLEIVDSLPYGGLQKVRRNVLKQMFAERHGRKV